MNDRTITIKESNDFATFLGVNDDQKLLLWLFPRLDERGWQGISSPVFLVAFTIGMKRRKRK